ncbi:aldo/keto reductase [Kribbella sp. VKM Ac-2568]|uniref:aldo/keto reductase n=1 Tax=Kribbella sp. VKM Ac-2568 TaxID=2512219 RepID=UPI001051A664|nr:aldo/keto reductase [Kribbella sp. VKM Ac-2568]
MSEGKPDDPHREVRATGVSNFEPSHLDHLASTSSVDPAVNQVEFHPYLVQPEVRAYGNDHGIATEAWSPLAKGGSLHPSRIRENPAGCRWGGGRARWARLAGSTAAGGL